MITWQRTSDSRGLFLDGGESSETDISMLLASLVECLTQGEIVDQGSANDLIFFEVNCDTGRIIAGISNEERFLAWLVDGCSLRSQLIQDFWYELLDTETSDIDFSSTVGAKVKKLGLAFKELVVERIPDLKKRWMTDRIRYRVYGNDIGQAVYEEDL